MHKENTSWLMEKLLKLGWTQQKLVEIDSVTNNTQQMDLGCYSETQTTQTPICSYSAFCQAGLGVKTADKRKEKNHSLMSPGWNSPLHM